MMRVRVRIDLEVKLDSPVHEFLLRQVLPVDTDDVQEVVSRLGRAMPNIAAEPGSVRKAHIEVEEVCLAPDDEPS